MSAQKCYIDPGHSWAQLNIDFLLVPHKGTIISKGCFGAKREKESAKAESWHVSNAVNILSL